MTQGLVSANRPTADSGIGLIYVFYLEHCASGRSYQKEAVYTHAQPTLLSPAALAGKIDNRNFKDIEIRDERQEKSTPLGVSMGASVGQPEIISMFIQGSMQANFIDSALVSVFVMYFRVYMAKLLACQKSKCVTSCKDCSGD